MDYHNVHVTDILEPWQVEAFFRKAMALHAVIKPSLDIVLSSDFRLKFEVILPNEKAYQEYTTFGNEERKKRRV